METEQIARTKMSASVQLECGCWVDHGLASCAGPDEFERTLRLMSDIFPHWLSRIETAHRCELVSEQNPDGEARAH